MRLKKCSRSGDIIEPIMKPQWWANMDDLAKRSVEAVESGELKIIPESRKVHWFTYLNNIQPWCISRQLWWGHQIPAWIIVKNGEKKEDINTCDRNVWIVARNEEEAHKLAKEKLGNTGYTLTRDEDVLDTWFSSGLFPFSVFGWPDKTEDMNRFYPTSVLETGHDIIFFWVARMVMMGLQLTGKLPFHTVYLHSMVRDAHGRKMSKTLGNVIDPIDVIEGITLEGLHETLEKGNLDPSEKDTAKAGQKKDFPKGISECGTDALRFGLCAYCQQGKDIFLDIKRIEAYRNFCNKIWNATILAWMHLSEYKPTASRKPTGNESNMDKWILHRLNDAINKTISSFENYEIGDATSAPYDFWLKETCDVYLEAIKPVMYGTDEKAKSAIRNTLYTILDEGYKLLAPFMPFITEELWQRLPRRPNDKTESICVAEFPTTIPERNNPQIEAEVQFLQKVIRTTRSILTSKGFTKFSKPEITLDLPDESTKSLIQKYSTTFIVLSYISNYNITINGSGDTPFDIIIPFTESINTTD
jgi:valyl-tRNA synthetase